MALAPGGNSSNRKAGAPTGLEPVVVVAVVRFWAELLHQALHLCEHDPSDPTEQGWVAPVDDRGDGQRE
jgi:hypothetical protein